MESMARIGSSIRIKGDVIAREPLVISGQVDGTIDATGHAVTLDETATVNAGITADTIVVAGKVDGTLLANVRIAIRATAVVEGELSAPSVGVADGATVRGRVETAQRKPALSLAS